MIIDITVPAAGESVAEAEITRWLQEEGAWVERDQPLAELETEKATQEVYAESAGVLKILIPAGETVQIGQVIGSIDTEAAASETEVEEPEEIKETAEETAEDDAENAVTDELSDETDEEDEAVDEPTITPINSQPHAHIDNSVIHNIPSPSARRLMVLNGISSQDVRGTGRDGRITKADVVRFLKLREKQLRIPSAVTGRPSVSMNAETRTPVPSSAVAPIIKAQKEASVEPSQVAGVRVEKMSRLRRTIANRLVQAQQTAAILTTFNEVDMSEVMALRKSYKDKFQEKYDVNLSFLSFFAKAVAIGLKEFPVINAQIQDDNIVYHDFTNLGIAVATQKGLVVPVIKNVQNLSFQEIERQIREYGAKGREGRIQLADMEGGTFTITNGGTFGSMLSTPILNRPQSAILGMHNIVQRPWVVNGAIEIRPIMYVALSYDHRLIDGAQAVRFLVTVKNCIEDPRRIMLEI